MSYFSPPFWEVVMRVLKLILLLSFISPITLFPQISFEKTYGGDTYDIGYCVQQTMDGGYVIAGESGNDVYLIKTDSLGDTLWTRTYDENPVDKGYCVKQTTDGGYIIAGATGFPAHYPEEIDSTVVYLIKTDSSGDILWARTYGSDYSDAGHAVQQTVDGGYIVAGCINCHNLGGDCDVYLIKTDSVGDTLWTRTYGSEYGAKGYAVQQTVDGGYIVAGIADYYWAEADVYLIKTDSFGDTLWTRTYSGDSWGYGKSVQQTTDGGCIVTGTISTDVYLIKTDSTGDTLWTKTYGSQYFDHGNSIQQTTDGGYIITGDYGYTGGSGTGNVYLIKTDSFGDTLWTRTYSGESIGSGKSVQHTTDGGYVITGWTFTSSYDVYLIKTDPDGYVNISNNNPLSIKLPRSGALSQNYPNPFNPTTTITFDVPGEMGEEKLVKFTIYDIRGRKVRTLVDSEYEPGTHRVIWDGRDDRGARVTSGVYLYTLRSGNSTYTRKMVMVK
jgi:hypothetical protein